MRYLREIRKAKGLTVRKCAEAVGVNHQKWTRWESLQTDPDREERDAIADFLGVTLDQLAGRQPFEAEIPQAVGQ